MLCTSRECPRGIVLAKQTQVLHAAGRAWLGDPFKAVGSIASSPDPNLIQQLIDRGRSEP
jgi:hypothetical protein